MKTKAEAVAAMKRQFADLLFGVWADSLMYSAAQHANRRWAQAAARRLCGLEARKTLAITGPFATTC
jgi:hypothetical protein